MTFQVYDLLADIFTSARRNPEIINIGGGGVVGGEPGVILDALDIDYGIIGEGEHTIVHLLELIDQKNLIKCTQSKALCSEPKTTKLKGLVNGLRKRIG